MTPPSAPQKCAKCHRYTRAEGSDLCLPCLNAAAVPVAARRIESCAQCLRDYFTGMEDEPPARRYKDPLCPKASPWCPLYEGIVERIRWAEERKGSTGLARTLDRIRMTMKARQMELPGGRDDPRRSQQRAVEPDARRRRR